MALNNSAIVDTTEQTCIDCNEIVFKWIDMDTGIEFWANTMGRSTCGRSGNFHRILE